MSSVISRRSVSPPHLLSCIAKFSSVSLARPFPPLLPFPFPPRPLRFCLLPLPALTTGSITCRQAFNSAFHVPLVSTRGRSVHFNIFAFLGLGFIYFCQLVFCRVVGWWRPVIVQCCMPIWWGFFRFFAIFYTFFLRGNNDSFIHCVRYQYNY